MGIIAKPSTFSPNTTISSSEVNDDFDTIYNEFNGNIAAANLASNAVTTAKIADSNVTTAKIADSNVTTAKIADGNVTVAKMAASMGAGTGGTGAWDTWTPTFVNLSGGALNESKYIQIGKTVFFRIGYSLAGAGVAGSVTFTLPVASLALSGQGEKIIGWCEYYDDNTTVRNVGHVRHTSTTIGTLSVERTDLTYLQVSALSSTVPFTWAANDGIQIQGFYQAA